MLLGPALHSRSTSLLRPPGPRPESSWPWLAGRQAAPAHAHGTSCYSSQPHPAQPREGTPDPLACVSSPSRAFTTGARPLAEPGVSTSVITLWHARGPTWKVTLWDPGTEVLRLCPVSHRSLPKTVAAGVGGVLPPGQAGPGVCGAGGKGCSQVPKLRATVLPPPPRPGPRAGCEPLSHAWGWGEGGDMTHSAVGSRPPSMLPPKAGNFPGPPGPQEATWGASVSPKGPYFIPSHAEGLLDLSAGDRGACQSSSWGRGAVPSQLEA